MNVAEMKGERIYLLGTRTIDEKEQTHYFIKIGCTADMRARLRCYDTYNPVLLSFNAFPSPSRAYSEAIEEAMLLLFVRGRQKRTEWYEVDRQTFDAFAAIPNFQGVKEFVRLEAYFDLKVTQYTSRAFEEEKPQNKRRYEAKAKELIELRRQDG